MRPMALSCFDGSRKCTVGAFGAFPSDSRGWACLRFRGNRLERAGREEQDRHGRRAEHLRGDAARQEVRGVQAEEAQLSGQILFGLRGRKQGRAFRHHGEPEIMEEDGGRVRNPVGGGP